MPGIMSEGSREKFESIYVRDSGFLPLAMSQLLWNECGLLRRF